MSGEGQSAVPSGTGRFWLVRPAIDGERSVLREPGAPAEDGAALKALIDTANGGWIRPSGGLPVWAFLNHLADSGGYLLHGSADPNIEVFEPRRPIDYSPDDFSKQEAVFAAGDGIWPIFYAVLNRPQPGLRFLNSALQFVSPGGGVSGMHYFFSVSRQDRAAPLWRSGTVYVLPREGFIRQPREQLGVHTIQEPHWASLNHVRPLAKVAVSPEDFPLLAAVREHDEAEVSAKALRDPNGYPWL